MSPATIGLIDAYKFLSQCVCLCVVYILNVASVDAFHANFVRCMHETRAESFVQYALKCQRFTKLHGILAC